MRLSSEMRRYLAEPRFGVLATVDEHGAPHQRVIWYELQRDGVLFNTRAGLPKERELTRDGRASLCVEDGYRFVAVRGRIVGEIRDQDIAHDDIRRLAIRYEGVTAAQRYRALWTDETRVSYLLRIERVESYGFTHA